ncbi:hypothetical protein ACQPYA_00240 [Micromonospora sp. CA-263727]|uniref:hypothetical protein n=1 Tax=Micromonospora sp. CA-263727 TaxID=3239967 RepID=UPI003D93033B
MAIDATSVDVADTPANVERFGRVGSGPKASAYPKLHIAALAECSSHAIVGAVLADLARLVRVVEYTVPDRNPDGELIAVVTTLTDHYEVPAMELAAAYQQRWEEESALDEIKTDLRGRGEVLRSKVPDLVEQQA